MLTDSLKHAVDYICNNDNVSRDCALCNITRQALRVIAEDRELNEAARVCFYSPKKSAGIQRPKWQSQAILDVVSNLLGNSKATIRN